MSHNFNSNYKIGSAQDAKAPYLTPTNRVSGIGYLDNNATSYRNLTSNLVYFNVQIPSGSQNMSVYINIGNNFPLGGTMTLGAQDNSNWSYQSQLIYSSLLQNLSYYKYGGENPKIYRINSNLSLVNNMNEIPKNSVVMTDLNLNPIENNQTFQIQNLTINTTLRGGHTFYVYLKNSLILKVQKQDLNWYNETDSLTMSLYSLNGDLIANSTIPDDGIDSVDKGTAIIQTGYLNATNLTPRVYKLVFSPSSYDGLIRSISINTNKIVTQMFFLADNSEYGLPANLSMIYTEAANPTYLTFDTYHSSGFQNISYNKKIFEIQETNANDELHLSSGNYTLSIPENDIIVQSQGWMSFSKGSYFNPFVYTIIPLGNNLAGADYVVTDYNPVQIENGWMTLNANFNLTGLYIKNGELSMLINTPHLSSSNNTEYIPIDWINTTVHKNGII